jgi:uncharacterized protein
MYVINRTRGTYLGVNVARAGSLAARMRGLYARRQFRLGDGLWLVPCTGVQTIGMGYPIDVVFLDARQRVVRVYEELKPGRFIWWVPKAHSALEVPQGAIRSSGTRVADQIELATAAAIELQAETPENPAATDAGAALTARSNGWHGSDCAWRS